MLERKYKKDNSFVFAVVVRGRICSRRTPHAARRTPHAARRTLPSLEQHNDVLPPLPSNLNKGKNEYTWNSLHKVACNGYSGASLFLSLVSKREGSGNDIALFLM